MQKDAEQVNNAIEKVGHQKGIQDKTLRGSIYKKGNELGELIQEMWIQILLDKNPHLI